MILIFTNHSDLSSSDVCEWIDAHRVSFVRLNSENLLRTEGNFSYQFTNEREVSHFLSSSVGEIISDEITSCWQRRDFFFREHSDVTHGLYTMDVNEEFIKVLGKHLWGELEVVKFVYKSVFDEKKLGTGDSRINKFRALKNAKQVGLSVPATLITSKKEDVLVFLKNYPNLITKALKEGIAIEQRTQLAVQYTEEITEQFMEGLPTDFFPSLFQEKLDKSVELRIFYLDGECYSMAIFSQLDTQTSVDFRRYNKTIPNRNVPYKLPQEIEHKIDAFMRSVNLNTGSIDMILTKDKRYVFLEVNPVGQFGMTSIPCNYYLEKKIAQFLATP